MPSPASSPGAFAVAERIAPIGHLLSLAGHLRREMLYGRLREIGLHPGQEMIVIDLHQNPGATQRAVVERLGMEQPTIAKSIQRLRTAGFVRSEPDPHDRRVTQQFLTPRGEAATGAITDAWAQMEHDLTLGLARDDLPELRAGLEALIANMTTR